MKRSIYVIMVAGYIISIHNIAQSACLSVPSGNNNQQLLFMHTMTIWDLVNKSLYEHERCFKFDHQRVTQSLGELVYLLTCVRSILEVCDHFVHRDDGLYLCDIWDRIFDDVTCLAQVVQHAYTAAYTLVVNITGNIRSLLKTMTYRTALGNSEDINLDFERLVFNMRFGYGVRLA